MKQKSSLKKLAFLGLASGLLAITQQALAHETNASQSTQMDPNAGNLGYHLMTEEELLLELNDEGAKLYQSLDTKGKELAREVASMRCAGTNLCKGLNACSTEKNDCAGKGACKGQGKCGISDKNFAVKLAAKKMGQKRMQAQNGNKS